MDRLAGDSARNMMDVVFLAVSYEVSVINLCHFRRCYLLNC